MKLSPHVTIYKFPVTAVSSIANRATGMTLSGAFVTGGLACLFGQEHQLIEYKNICEPFILFSGVYHTLGGVRHLIWDKYPGLLTKTAVARSSYGLIGGSVLLSGVIYRQSIENAIV